MRDAAPRPILSLQVIGGSVFFEVPAVGNTSVNPWAVDLGVTTLSTPGATQLDKALQLRFVLHLVGDLHQPLHAASYFSAQFPSGDAGGNLWNVSFPSNPNITELHSLWDSGIGQWATDIVRPLNASGAAWLQETAAALQDAYPPSAFVDRLAVTDPFLWAVESNGLAGSVSYACPQAPAPIPSSYISDATAVAESQVALAGYRLAQLLESIFNANSPHYGKMLAAARSRAMEAVAKLKGKAGARARIAMLRSGGRN